MPDPSSGKIILFYISVTFFSGAKNEYSIIKESESQIIEV